MRVLAILLLIIIGFASLYKHQQVKQFTLMSQIFSLLNATHIIQSNVNSAVQAQSNIYRNSFSHNIALKNKQQGGKINSFGTVVAKIPYLMSNLNYCFRLSYGMYFGTHLSLFSSYLSLLRFFAVALSQRWTMCAYLSLRKQHSKNLKANLNSA